MSMSKSGRSTFWGRRFDEVGGCVRRPLGEIHYRGLLNPVFRKVTTDIEFCPSLEGA